MTMARVYFVALLVLVALALSGCAGSKAIKASDKVADLALVKDCSPATRVLRASLVNDHIQQNDAVRFPQQTAAVKRAYDLMVFANEQGASLDAAGTAFFADVMILVGRLLAERGVDTAAMVSTGNYLGLLRMARQVLRARYLRLVEINARVTAECQVQSRFDNAVQSIEMEDQLQRLQSAGG